MQVSTNYGNQNKSHVLCNEKIKFALAAFKKGSVETTIRLGDNGVNDVSEKNHRFFVVIDQLEA